MKTKMKNIEFINARQKAKDFPDTFKLFDESELKVLRRLLQKIRQRH